MSLHRRKEEELPKEGGEETMLQDQTRRRLAELMLYVADKMQGNPTFGATKLNKVLFYCDFLWFRDHGKPISGATYQKLDHGPAPRELLPALSLLQGEDAAALVARTYLGRTQKRLVAKRPADLSLFTAEEISRVDQVIEWLGDASAAKVSEYSHHLGWKLADFHEEIPYFTAHLSDEGALPSDIKRGLELAKEHGWGMKTNIDPLQLITLTVNVKCKQCEWVGVYPLKQHEQAAKDAAEHVYDAHMRGTGRQD